MDCQSYTGETRTAYTVLMGKILGKVHWQNRGGERDIIDTDLKAMGKGKFVPIGN
jgi:hypothetical protein